MGFGKHNNSSDNVWPTSGSSQMGLGGRSFQDGRFSSNFNWSSWARIWQGLDEGGKLGALLDLLQLLLGLPELGQVEGGDLLGLLDLLLVGLDLGLQLGGQVGHPVLVLLVLASGEGELLALALSTLISLGGLSSASLGAGELGLQLVDLVLQLGHGGLATLGGGVLGISKASLELSQLVVQGLLGGSLGRGVVLLGAELVSKTSSVDHRLLGLLLGVLGSAQHGVHLSLDGVDGSLEAALGGHVAAVDDLHVVDGVAAIGDLHLELPLGALRTVHQSLGLLQLAGEGGGLALRDADLLHDLGAGARLVLVQLDRLLQLRLVALDGLQSLGVGLVGVVKADLELVDLALKSLLDPQGLTLGLLLGLKRSRHGLHGASVVLPGVVELLLLLGHAPVNLLLDLSKLQLGTKDLVLLLLEGALSLLKSSLQLLLLLLKPPPLLVQVVDGAAALTKLVEKVLDLVGKVLVLALDNVQLLKSLFLGGLQPEQLGGVVATLVLGGSDLGGDISGLGLPLVKHLVEVLAPLLSDKGSGVHPLVLHGQVVELVVHPDLGLFSVGNLGGESVDQLLVLNDLGLQLVAGSLELLNTAHALGLEAGLPQLDLSLGLGESLQGIRLPHGLVLHLLPQVLEVSGHHLVLGQQRRAVLALSISQSLGVLQLGGDRDLALVHVGNGGLKLVDLAGEILVLDLQPLLG